MFSSKSATWRKRRIGLAIIDEPSKRLLISLQSEMQQDHHRGWQDVETMFCDHIL
jgi:hypothetical protein